MTYAAFFHRATLQNPYPYQHRFAEADELHHLVRAPTGAGKTACQSGLLVEQSEKAAPLGMALENPRL